MIATTLRATLLALGLTLASATQADAVHFFSLPLVEPGVTKGPNNQVFTSLRSNDYANAGDTVVFIGDCGESGAGIYRAAYDSVTRIANPTTRSPGVTGNFTSFLRVAQQTGDVFFSATDSLGTGLFRWRTGTITRIVDTTYLISGTSNRITSIGDIVPGDGYLAFYGQAGGADALMAVGGGAVFRIADRGQNMPGTTNQFSSIDNIEWYGEIPLFIGNAVSNRPRPIASVGNNQQILPDPVHSSGDLRAFVYDNGVFSWHHATTTDFQAVDKSIDFNTAYRLADTDTLAPGVGVPFARFSTLSSDAGALAFVAATAQDYFTDVFCDYGGTLQRAFGAPDITSAPAVVSLVFNHDAYRGKSLAVFAQPNLGAPSLYRIEAVSGPSYPVRFDPNFDGRDDLAIFDPTSARLMYRWITNTFRAARAFTSSDALPAMADFDGDTKDDIAVFRPSDGQWQRWRSALGLTTTNFGYPGCVPVPADYDKDNKADLAVFNANDGGSWYLLCSGVGFQQTKFGFPGCVPVVGDYDGDRRADIAVYDPRTAMWYLRQSTAGFAAINFGFGNVVPAPADYDGDGRTDIAVYDAATGTWYILRSTAGFTTVQFGYGTTRPAPGDFDKDGKDDIAIYDFENGKWYLNRSTAGFLAP